MSTRLFLAVALSAAITLPAAASELRLPEKSPLAKVQQTVGVTDVAVEYSSPGVKARKVFGDLVPFDKLWRTGANAATKLTVSEDVSVMGKALPAGTYAVFTIPGKKRWTFILNKNANQGGTRSYDAKLDAVRVEVTPAKAATPRERMTFLFEDTTDDGTKLVLEWDKTRVVVPITVDTAALAQRNIDGLMATGWGPLNSAARHLAATGKLDAALAAADASIAVKETWFNTWIKATILADKGDYAAAYPVAERAYAMGKKADYFFFEKQVEKALADWKSKR